MKLAWLLAGTLALPAWLAAQNISALLPSGTLLPVTLDHGLKAGQLHAGQIIRARLMQSVPDSEVHRGAHVVGRVVQVRSAPRGPAEVEIRFDAIESGGHRIPIRTDLRALASPLEVEEAKMPEEMSSRGMTPETWTTQQIGGDQVYRGGGPVTEDLMPVAKPVAYGVEGQPRPNQPCRGEIAGNGRPQALWLFSADACGVYGFPDVSIEHAGRNSGTIALAAQKGRLSLGGGSALLLRVE